MKMIAVAASRRTFSGWLGGCLVPTDYTETFRGYPLTQLISKWTASDSKAISVPYFLL